MAIETATLGGGCFWCVEAALQTLRGVTAAVPGYAGGEDPHPTYERVGTGATGHAEVVQVGFDTDRLDFRTLLEVFFTIHDPTTLNRQGADVGTQYRSVIFHHTDAQRDTALRTIAELDAAAIWPAPIVTGVHPLPAFHPAEMYHWNYYRQHPHQGYCQAVIAPKLARLRARHAALLAD